MGLKDAQKGGYDPPDWRLRRHAASRIRFHMELSPRNALAQRHEKGKKKQVSRRCVRV